MECIFQMDPETDFSLHNIPFGIFSRSGSRPSAATRIGDFVLPLFPFCTRFGVPVDTATLNRETLNDFARLGKDARLAVRETVRTFFCAGNEERWEGEDYRKYLIPVAEVQMHLPFRIGDYTDFYSSEYHAANVGAMFRDPQNPLLPNWKHIPVGYHGRSSSIVISGTDFCRPRGQIKPAKEDKPVFGPSAQVDLELETAFFLSRDTRMGESIPVDTAEDWIFGMVLFNDWSARDIQSWEYVPLGPFLGKNFASSVSAWVVTPEALRPFRVPMAAQTQPSVLPYLDQRERFTYDIGLEAELITANGHRLTICRTNQKYLYWSMNQQLAHHAVNGCPMQAGDLLASGTISGPDPGSLGCLLEITRRGENPLHTGGSETRTFLADGDEIVLRGFARRDGIRVGFGEVRGKVLPARS